MLLNALVPEYTAREGQGKSATVDEMWMMAERC